MKTHYIILTTVNDWPEAKKVLDTLSPKDVGDLLLITDSSAVQNDAESYETTCLLLAEPFPRTSFEDQARCCAKILKKNNVCPPDEHLSFVPVSSMKHVVSSVFPERDGPKGSPSLFLQPVQTDRHPMAMKSGYVLLDMIFAVRVQAPLNDCPYSKTKPFFFNWLSYGVVAESGMAGVGKGNDEKGYSMMVEEQMARKIPPFSTPVEMTYSIHGKQTASRYIEKDEWGNPALPLQFVPAYRKVERSSVLFVKRSDGSVSILLKADLAEHDLSLLFFPSKEEEGKKEPFTIHYTKGTEEFPNQSFYYGKAFVEPLPPCNLPWDSFLCVILGHTTRGDVDFFHHFPIDQSLYSYDPETDTRYMNDGKKPYGRQSYPRLYSPLVLEGKLNDIAETPAANIVRTIVQTGAGTHKNMTTVPRPSRTLGPAGFCSEVRRLSNALWKLEEEELSPTPQAIKAFKQKLNKSMDDLRPHLLMRQFKFFFKERMASEISELPLMKLLNCQDTIVKQAWKACVEMLTKRLPALRRNLASPEDKVAELDEHVSYWIGEKEIQRGLDIFPSNDDGSVWVTDIDGQRILGFNADNNPVAILSERITSPRYFFADKNNINFCDPFAKRIFTITPSGELSSFKGPSQFIHDGHVFHPLNGHVVDNGYVFGAMTEARMVGYFRYDSDTSILTVLVPPQHARHSLEIFTADAKRMVLASPNESTLHIYDFESESWEQIFLHEEALTINGLSISENILYIRTPPNILKFNLVTHYFEYILHAPDLFGTARWPYPVFRCFQRNGKNTIFNGSSGMGITAIEVDQ